MRSYGIDPATNKWTTITDPSYIYLATVAQTLRLALGESPFYGNYGIPAQQSVINQIAPNLAVNNTQNQYAPYFASLSMTSQSIVPQPTYAISAVLQNGTTIQTTVAT